MLFLDTESTYSFIQVNGQTLLPEISSGKAIQQKKVTNKMKIHLITEIHTPGAVSRVKWEGWRAHFSFGQQQSEAAQIGAVYQDIPSCAP